MVPMETANTLEIVDGHHHIWRVVDLPWLQAKPTLKIFGDSYQAIQRDYLIEEFLADSAPSRVVASVFVQANWPGDKSTDEVAWVQSVADRHGLPQAIVGFVDLSSPDRERLIDQQMQFKNLRGIRQQVYWHATNPSYRFGTRSDLMSDAYWRSAMELLSARNLLFELQVFPEQMAEAAQLVADYPKTQFVLVHAGMLEDESPAGWEAWRSGMSRLASFKNVAVKLSGVGTFRRKVDSDLIKKLYGGTVSIFGADRCLFGSNFPVEKVWTDFQGLMNAVRQALSDLPDPDQKAVFNLTARRIYRI
jgi:predicted TIM-barrel fold metal-dependent hydrolase